MNEYLNSKNSIDHQTREVLLTTVYNSPVHDPFIIPRHCSYTLQAWPVPSLQMKEENNANQFCDDMCTSSLYMHIGVSLCTSLTHDVRACLIVFTITAELVYRHTIGHICMLPRTMPFMIILF